MFQKLVLLCLLMLSGCLEISAAAESDLDAVKKLMTKPLVDVEVKDTSKAGTPGIPPLASQKWVFDCSGVQREISYTRYLNREPEFMGAYPSLTSADMGIGFGGGAFNYWYYNGAIRILVDGTDIMQIRCADLVEHRSGDTGKLKMVWDLDGDDRLVLYFTVPADGRAIYAAIEPQIFHKLQYDISVELVCYPGGFGPAYNLPSIRSASTQTAKAVVPRYFKVSESNPLPKLNIKPTDKFIYYSDGYAGSGSLMLVMADGEWDGGNAAVSNYGINTRLTVRKGRKAARLGFYASEMENAAAYEYFMQILPEEIKNLSSIGF